MTFSRLTYVWAAEAVAYRFLSVDDTGVPFASYPHRYPAFCIDGVPLMDLLEEHAQRNGQSPLRDEIKSRIAPFGWGDISWQEWSKRILLGEESSAFSSGRCPVLSCPFDADPYCDAISVRLVREAGAITWQDFACEAEGSRPPKMEQFAGLGPFRFALAEYTRVMSEVCRVVTPGHQGLPKPPD